MKNQPGTMKNHKSRPGIMKNQTKPTKQNLPTNQIKLTKLNILSQGNHESKRSPTLECIVPLAMFLELLVLARKPERKVEKERHGVEICAEDAHNGSSLHLLRPLWVSLGAEPLQVKRLSLQTWHT